MAGALKHEINPTLAFQETNDPLGFFALQRCNRVMQEPQSQVNVPCLC